MTVESPALPAPPALEAVREGNENLVRLTEPAGAKVGALIARDRQGEFLRIAISGGGCNGLSYKLRFVAAPKRGDILVRSAGAAVLVDPKTALYLKGTAGGLFGQADRRRIQVRQPEREGKLLLRR